MSERIVTISGLTGIYADPVPAAPSMPKGATRVASSPTGYVIGSSAPGLPWLVDVADVMQAKSTFGFKTVKMTYWDSNNKGFSQNDVDTMVSAVDKSNRWVVVLVIHPANSPYCGIYAVPKDFKDAVTAFGKGNISEALIKIRQTGETLVHEGAEVAKVVVETAGDVAKKAADLGNTLTKALTIFAVITALGLTAYGVDKVTDGKLFGTKKAS